MTRMLGPASTPAAMLQTSAAPLVELLGFHTPERVERLDSVVAATLASAATPVAIIVTSWAEPLDPLWRLAVTQALQRCAVWCVLFDGLRLRLIDASRLYARRYRRIRSRSRHSITRSPSPRSGASFSAASLTADPVDSCIASRARRRIRSPRRRRLPVAARRRARRVGRRPARAARHGRRRRGSPPGAHAAFEQALTIVYRMLFLLFAEARGARAAVASGLSRQLQPRGVARRSPSDARRERRACGTRFARSPASRTRAAAPATCA